MVSCDMGPRYEPSVSLDSSAVKNVVQTDSVGKIWVVTGDDHLDPGVHGCLYNWLFDKDSFNVIYHGRLSKMAKGIDSAGQLSYELRKLTGTRWYEGYGGLGKERYSKEYSGDDTVWLRVGDVQPVSDHPEASPGFQHIEWNWDTTKPGIGRDTFLIMNDLPNDIFHLDTLALGPIRSGGLLTYYDVMVQSPKKGMVAYKKRDSTWVILDSAEALKMLLWSAEQQAKMYR